MLSWLADLAARSRIDELERDCALLRTKVESLELENDLLGEINENLRRWMLANTACAVQVGRSMGMREKDVRE